MPRVISQERRDSVRVPGSYPVQLWDTRGRPIGRGRTANISQGGLFVLLPAARAMAVNAVVEVEMNLPLSPGRLRSSRTVRYRARIVRLEAVGQWRGVGLELLEKLG